MSQRFEFVCAVFPFVAVLVFGCRWEFASIGSVEPSEQQPLSQSQRIDGPIGGWPGLQYALQTLHRTTSKHAVHPLRGNSTSAVHCAEQRPRNCCVRIGVASASHSVDNALFEGGCVKKLIKRILECNTYPTLFCHEL